MKRLQDVGIDVTVYTSGWSMQEKSAIALADAVSSVAVSIDGADAAIHDAIWAPGAFECGMKALDVLHRVKDERRSAGETCFTFGIDYNLPVQARKKRIRSGLSRPRSNVSRGSISSASARSSSRSGRRANVRGKRASSLEELVDLLEVGRRLAARAWQRPRRSP